MTVIPTSSTRRPSAGDLVDRLADGDGDRTGRPDDGSGADVSVAGSARDFLAALAQAGAFQARVSTRAAAPGAGHDSTAVRATGAAQSRRLPIGDDAPASRIRPLHESRSRGGRDVAVRDAADRHDVRDAPAARTPDRDATRTDAARRPGAGKPTADDAGGTRGATAGTSKPAAGDVTGKPGAAVAADAAGAADTAGTADATTTTGGARPAGQGGTGGAGIAGATGMNSAAGTGPQATVDTATGQPSVVGAPTAGTALADAAAATSGAAFGTTSADAAGATRTDPITTTITGASTASSGVQAGRAAQAQAAQATAVSDTVTANTSTPTGTAALGGTALPTAATLGSASPDGSGAALGAAAHAATAATPPTASGSAAAAMLAGTTGTTGTSGTGTAPAAGGTRAVTAAAGSSGADAAGMTGTPTFGGETPAAAAGLPGGPGASTSVAGTSGPSGATAAGGTTAGAGTSTMEAQHVVDQVMKHLVASRTLRDGTQRTVLHLAPDHLGAVTVTVDVRGGVVRVELAAKDAAYAALRDGVGDLRRTLTDAGLDLADVTVHDRGADAGRGDASRGWSGRSQAEPFGDAMASDARTGGSPGGRGDDRGARTSPGSRPTHAIPAATGPDVRGPAIGRRDVAGPLDVLA